MKFNTPYHWNASVVKIVIRNLLINLMPYVSTEYYVQSEVVIEEETGVDFGVNIAS